MVNILICDDDKYYKCILESKISKIFEKNLNIAYNIGYCNNLNDLEENLRTESIDIVFLDVIINEENSIDWMIEKQMMFSSAQYIIITSFPVESYRISEVDCCYFLIKSKMYDMQLLKAIKKAINNISKKEGYQKIIKSKGKNHTINLQNIAYIETFNNNIVVHMITNEEYTVYSSLKSFSKDLPPNFLRCHKSFLINMNYIVSYERYQFTLKNNANVQISPRSYLKVVNDYKNYLLNL